SSRPPPPSSISRSPTRLILRRIGAGQLACTNSSRRRRRPRWTGPASRFETPARQGVRAPQREAVERLRPSPGGLRLLLEALDLVLLDHRQADVVEAVEQAMLAVGVDLELDHAAVGAPD